MPYFIHFCIPTYYSSALGTSVHLRTTWAIRRARAGVEGGRRPLDSGEPRTRRVAGAQLRGRRQRPPRGRGDSTGDRLAGGPRPAPRFKPGPPSPASPARAQGPPSRDRTVSPAPRRPRGHLSGLAPPPAPGPCSGAGALGLRRARRLGGPPRAVLPWCRRRCRRLSARCRRVPGPRASCAIARGRAARTEAPATSTSSEWRGARGAGGADTSAGGRV